jgi:hypothetical protein
MKTILGFIKFTCIVAIIFLNSGIYGQDINSYYINTLYFNKKTDILKSGFDRWEQISQAHLKGEDPTKYNHGIYGAVYDFNVAEDVNGDKIYPQLFGLALGERMYGVYFIGYTSDFAKGFRNNEERSEDFYNAGSIGAHLNLKYITFKGDVSVDSESTSMYARTMIPLLRTYAGVRYSKYQKAETETGENTGIVEADKYKYDIIDGGTSIFRIFNLGLTYYRLTEAPYVPNISASIHQLFDKKNWSSMEWDAEIYFESRNTTLNKSSELKDYEVRFVLYKLIGNSLIGASGVQNNGIDVRFTIYAGISYKSTKEVDSSTNILTENEKIYNGQNGVGGEIGIGLRILGFKEYGFNEDTYIKFCYFYNYSEYFDRYPGIQSGFKFRVIF